MASQLSWRLGNPSKFGRRIGCHCRRTVLVAGEVESDVLSLLDEVVHLRHLTADEAQ